MKLLKPTAIILISSALLWGQGQDTKAPKNTTTSTAPIAKEGALVVAAPVVKKKSFVRKKKAVSKNSLKVISPMSFQLIMGDTVDVLGYAPPKATVIVGGKSTTANKKGLWEIKLPTPKKSGSQWIKIKAAVGTDTLRQHIVYTKATKEQEKKPELVAKAKKQKEQAKKKLKKLIKKKRQEESFNHYERPETVYSIGMFDFFVDSSNYVVPVNYVNYLNEVLIGNEFFGLKDLPKTAKKCKEYECANDIITKNGFDFFVLGKVAKQDSVTVLSVELYDAYSDIAIDQITFQYTAFKSFDGKMKNLAAELKTKLQGLIEDVGKDDADKKWEKTVFEPFTTHLKGTRLDTIMPDTLKKSESPYIITKSMTVAKGRMLIIEPGVQVFFGGQNVDILVKGQVVAIATKEEPIRFSSGRDIPRDDDWNKMVFANSHGNIFSWVEFSNAKHGMRFINSSGTIQNTKILYNKNNSIHLQSSDVAIYDSQIAGGALVGLLVDEFATATVERSRFYNNVNAIAVRPMGNLSLKRSLVENNEKGMLLLSDIALTMNKVRIRKNQYGVISSKKIDTDNFDFNNNEINFKLLDGPVIERVIETAIYGQDKSKSLVIEALKTVDSGLKLGIYSIKEKTELNILGNLGLRVGHHLVSHENVAGPKPYSYGTNETALVGDEYPNDKLQDGLVTNFSVYTALDYGDFVMEYSMDGAYDEWIGDSDVKTIAYIDPISLKLGTKNHTIQMGDFNEVGGELSFSGRDILGAKYFGKFGGDEYNKPVLSATLVYGEAQSPFDVGVKNPESFNEIIDENQAVTQEMLLFTQLEIFTSNYSSLTIGYVQSENSRTGFQLGRTDIESNSGLNDPEKISNSKFWRGYWTNQKGTFEVKAEIAYGYSDTLNSAQINGGAAFMTYLEQKFDTDSTTGEAARTNFIDTSSYINDISDRLTKGEKVLSEDVFNSILFDLSDSANPFNETEDDSLFIKYKEFLGQNEKETTLYQKLKHNMAYKLELEYFFPQSSLAMGTKIITPKYYSPGSGNSVTANSRNYFASYSQSIFNDLNIELDYNLDINNAGSTTKANFFGFAEGSTPGIQKGKDDTKNGVRPLYIHDIKIGSDYRINKMLSIDGEYAYRFESQKDENTEIRKSDDALIYKDPFFKGTGVVGAATDTTIDYYGEAVNVDVKKLDYYKSAHTVFMNNFESKEATHSISFNGKLDLNPMNQIKLGMDIVLTYDKSEFYNDSLFYIDTTTLAEIPLSLTPETLDELGYYPGGDDKIRYSFPIEYNLKIRSMKLNNKFKIKPIFETIVKNDETSTEYQFSDKFSMKILKNKITLTLAAGYTMKSVNENDLRYFVVDTVNAPTVKNYHYDETADALFTTEQATTNEVSASHSASGNQQTKIESFVDIIEENDWYVSFIGKYNITSRMYVEATVKYDTFERPQALESQYTDLFTELNFQYSF